MGGAVVRGETEDVRIHGRHAESLAAWAVWASTGTTRSDFEELVRSSIELDTEVDQIVAALASDIAVIGDTAGLPFEGWGDQPGPLAGGPVDVSQWAQVAFFAKAPGISKKDRWEVVQFQ